MKSRDLWILAGLVVVGLLVRATRLTESLWYDEIAAWRMFGMHGPGAITTTFFEPSNHIAHTFLSWCSVKALEWAIGFELALRLPALLFSLGAVAAVFGLARCASGPRVAVIAAGLMAVLPVPVLEGAEARGYSMMICFSALTSWAFLVNVAKERVWRWCVYAGLCAAGAWAHPMTAFVPIGHAAWLGWQWALHRRVGLALRGGVALMLAALITLSLYAPVIPEILAQRGMYTAARGDEPLVFGTEGWHALLQLGGSWYPWDAWPGVALAVFGLIRARRDPAVAVTLLGLPIFLVVVLATGTWMYARFALFSVPGAVLLIAVGLEALARRNRIVALAAGAVVLAASAADLALRPPKQPLRDAAAYVRAHRSDGEPVLVVGLAHQVMDLYLDGPKYSLQHGADLDEKISETGPAWVLLYYPQHVSAASYALLDQRGFAEEHRLDGWVDWNNGDVLVYRQR
ncbi:MAG: glycosyltransferase family 39 protein [Planctomycetota bacterium]